MKYLLIYEVLAQRIRVGNEPVECFVERAGAMLPYRAVIAREVRFRSQGHCRHFRCLPHFEFAISALLVEVK